MNKIPTKTFPVEFSPSSSKGISPTLPLPEKPGRSGSGDASSDEDVDSGLFAGRVRFLMLALTTVCLTLAMCNGAALHFTVICMKVPLSNELAVLTSVNVSSAMASTSATLPSPPAEQPMFSFAQQGWLFSGLAQGTLLASLASDFLCQWLGFRRLTTLFGLTNGLATLATPLVATLLPQPANFVALSIARILQGLVLALSFVAMSKLSCRWSPLSESTLFMGVISTHLTLGRTIVPPVAGMLCESPLGWPSVFYCFGSMTIAAFLLFHWLFRDNPHKHRKVSRAELSRIESGREPVCCASGKPLATEGAAKQQKQAKSNARIYMELLSDPHVWGLFVSDLGVVFGNQLLAQYGPTYLKNAIGLSTQRAGFISALPFLLSAIMATSVGRLCDRLTWLRTRPKLVVLGTTSGPQYVMALCYVCLALLPVSASLLVQCTYTAVLLFPGVWFVGVVKHMQLVAARHNLQALIAVNTAWSYLCMIFVPSFVNLLISREPEAASDEEQWSRIFLVVAVVQLLCGTLSQLSVHILKPRN